MLDEFFDPKSMPIDSENSTMKNLEEYVDGEMLDELGIVLPDEENENVTIQTMEQADYFLSLCQKAEKEIKRNTEIAAEYIERQKIKTDRRFYFRCKIVYFVQAETSRAKKSRRKTHESIQRY